MVGATRRRLGRQGVREVVAEVICGHKAAKDWVAIPAAIFTDPEIAVAGLSEAQAKEKGIDVRVGKFPFAALGRAIEVAQDPARERHDFGPFVNQQALQMDNFAQCVREGRDSILLRLTLRSAKAWRTLTKAPGLSGNPQNTTDVFQLFALSGAADEPGETPGRAALVKAMAGRILAAGLLTGTYSRGEPAMSGAGVGVARAAG